jgi:hypothetical protein
MASGYKWKPLERATPLPPSEALIGVAMSHYKLDREGALAALARELQGVEIWRNDLYQIEVRRMPSEESVHLNIRRIDGYPGRDWRHFQQIKNELVGPECEAVELYPAESRLTDTTNKYHLYCCSDPTFRFPFGFKTRDVQFEDYGEGGLRQRPPMQHAGGRR